MHTDSMGRKHESSGFGTLLDHTHCILNNILKISWEGLHSWRVVGCLGTPKVQLMSEVRAIGDHAFWLVRSVLKPSGYHQNCTAVHQLVSEYMEYRKQKNQHRRKVKKIPRLLMWGNLRLAVWKKPKEKWAQMKDSFKKNKLIDDLMVFVIFRRYFW